MIMISAKMMKSKSGANLERYGTDEHIAGIGMATKENDPIYKGVLGGECVSSFTEKIVRVIPCDLGYEIMTDQKTCFTIKTQYTDVVPSIEDSITFYTISFSMVVGIKLNGKLLYFLNEKDL